MMPLTNKTRSLTLVLMLFAITIPLFVSLYFSKPSKNPLFQGVRLRKANTDFTRKSKMLNNEIFLLKDSHFANQNLKLIFKGIKNGMICLDVFLLELDPLKAYPYMISKTAAMKGIRLGDSRFCLISANKNVLKIKIDDLYGT